MLNRLIPRDEQFFDLFNQLAEHLKTAAGLLNQLFADPSRTASNIRTVRLVFKDGVGYDPGRLLESVKGLVGIR